MAHVNLMIDARVQCSTCKSAQLVRVTASAKLKPGDALYSDPRNDNFGRCVKCKRQKMIVIEVETFTSISKPQGFWRIPQAQEDGSSESTSTTEDEKP